MGCKQSTAVPSVTENFDSLSPSASSGVGGSLVDTVQDASGNKEIGQRSEEPRKMPASAMPESLPVAINRDVVPRRFSEHLWNAFGDGAVVALKAAHEKRYHDMNEVINYFINMFDHISREVLDFSERFNGEDKELEHNGIAADALLPALFPKPAVLLERQAAIRTKLESEVLHSWANSFNNHWLAIEKMEKKQASLVQFLSERDEDCTKFQRDYEKACAAVDKAVQERDQKADGNSTQGRQQLKANVDKALTNMIDNEEKYQQAIETFHGFQKEMKAETGTLLDELQALTEAFAVDAQTCVLRLGECIRGAGDFLVGHTSSAEVVMKSLCPLKEIEQVVQQYRSDGVFEAQMRRFVSAESAMTTKQRKQYALAQEAYKLESGETAEDSFLRIMKAPGKDSSAGGGGAGNQESNQTSTETISLEAMTANSRSLAAQSKWKSKHGFAGGNKGARKSNTSDNITDSGKKRPVARPSFRKSSLSQKK